MSWRSEVVSALLPGKPLTLAVDPDGLLAEEGVLQELRERGFEVIPFEDPIAFRFAYESRYRSRWDAGSDAGLVVVLRTWQPDLIAVPYDLQQAAGKPVRLSLADLFPLLSAPVLEQMPLDDLDALWDAREEMGPDSMGENRTLDFLLARVFEMDAAQARDPVGLLHLLLKRHSHGRIVPPLFDNRFIQALGKTGSFVDWPLDEIVRNSSAFFDFLQERWPTFLSTQLALPLRESSFRFSGPARLPLDHPSVWPLVDSLFLEGRLKPVELPGYGDRVKGWMAVGVRLNPEADRARRFRSLLDRLENAAPGPNARHREWLEFARSWAELLVLAPAPETAGEPAYRLNALRSRVDELFAIWMLARYDSLRDLPLPPVMVHHIPRLLARDLAATGPANRVALVVMDGLAMDGWAAIRPSLAAQDASLHLEESAVFAGVPTTTSVSRQAIFAGKLPLYFARSIQGTAKEESQWRQFWAENDLDEARVGYCKGLGVGSSEAADSLISDPRIRVLGLVVDQADVLAHAWRSGAHGLHSQLQHWMGEGFLVGLLQKLIADGFRTYVTSDHGNTRAVGAGRLSDGSLAEERGRRVRVYHAPGLRSQAAASRPGAIEWNSASLPDSGYYPLLCGGRDAFMTQGEELITHGGITLEEVVVPFITITREASS